MESKIMFVHIAVKDLKRDALVVIVIMQSGSHATTMRTRCPNDGLRYLGNDRWPCTSLVIICWPISDTLR